MRFITFFYLLTSPLWAVQIDPNTKNFEQRQQRFHVDVYDFIGEYPQLEHIDIDARRKKKVEINLTGSYPILDHIVYEGGFGSLQGQLTGKFPSLRRVEILCGNTAMNFNLCTEWTQSCLFTFKGSKEPIVLKLPEKVGVVAYVNSQLGASVTPGPLKKKGWWRMTHRVYKNQLADTAPVVLTLHIEAVDAPIIFE